MTAAPSTVQSKTRSGRPVIPPIGLCHRWILVGLFQKKSNDYIRAVQTADSLPCPTDGELDTMRAEYVPAKLKLKSPKAAAIFERLGISHFMREDPVAIEALALLREPRSRELAEAGLIAGVPKKSISDTLFKYVKHVVSPVAIVLYRNMFFDVQAVTRAQLRAFVHERVRLALTRVCNPTDEATIARAISSDPRIVAMSMPSSPTAWASALMAAGHAPPRYELVNVIEQMETLATLRTNEALLRGEPGDERRAESFIGVLTKVHELKEMVVTPEAQLAKSLATFQLRTSDKGMKSAVELCGDRRTVDIGPPLAEPDGT